MVPARHLVTTIVWLGILLGPAQGRADETRSPIRLRTTVGTGLVMSADQHALLRLDLPVLEGQARIGWMPTEFLVLEAALSGGAFLSSGDGVGALVDLTLGGELGVDAGLTRPWISAHLGAGLTGTLVRPVLRIAVGIDIVASPELALGPALAYGHVFQEDGPGFTDDAQFLTLGITLTFRPADSAPPPAPPPPRAPPRERPPPRPSAPSPTSTQELMVLIDEATGIAPRELLVPVLFAYDSTEIVPCSVSALHALREHLEAHPEILVLEIEGHADDAGTDAYNDALSLRRAEAVRDWLVERDIDGARLRVAAQGERAPVEGNEEDAGREQNRRARFRVLEEAP